MQAAMDRFTRVVIAIVFGGLFGLIASSWLGGQVGLSAVTGGGTTQLLCTGFLTLLIIAVIFQALPERRQED
jgi:hypothetical protein